MYDQAQGLNNEGQRWQWNSIEGLLGDEQGLRMGEMLTVKLRQPSHEFTFGVGMTFISYPLAWLDDEEGVGRTSKVYAGF
jgi:hypothetical protein